MAIQDGYYAGVITSADIIRSRYAKEGENRMEVELTCSAKAGDGSVIADDILIYLELSADYPKFGDASKPFWQQTLDKLHSVGFKGQDLSTVRAQLSGRDCRLNYRTKDKNGQPLKNPGWYFSSERERIALNGAQANAALAAMMSVGGSGFSVAPAVNTPNPFAE